MPVVRRALLGLCLALLTLLLVPGALLAHGALRASTPARGARLAAAPRTLRLEFSEPVALGLARVSLVGADGVAVALGPLVHPGDSTRVLVTPVTGPVGAGAHVIRWQVAGRDGHPVRGEIRFTVLAPAAPAPEAAEADRTPATPPTAPAVAGTAAGGTAVGSLPPAAPPAPTPPASAVTDAGFDAESPLYAVVRWLGYLATVATVGAVAVRTVVLPRAGHPAGAATAVARFGGRAAAALVIATVLRLAAQRAALGADVPLTAMLGTTTWGLGWLLALAGGLLALVGFWRGGAPAVPVAGALLVAIGSALTGHAVAGRLVAPSVAADAVHVLAAGAWIGGLLVLVAVVLPAVRAAGAEGGGRTAAVVGAFSPVALACAAALVLTGAWATWTDAGSPAALLGSRWGWLLLLKLAVVGGVAGIGAYNWRRVRPQLAADGDAGPRLLARSARAELALAAVVLAITAVLVATPIPLDGP